MNRPRNNWEKRGLLSVYGFESAAGATLKSNEMMAGLLSGGQRRARVKCVSRELSSCPHRPILMDVQRNVFVSEATLPSGNEPIAIGNDADMHPFGRSCRDFIGD
jgi:hypothetical protein